MIRNNRLISVIALILLVAIGFTSCGNTVGTDSTTTNGQIVGIGNPTKMVDYVSQCHLDMDSTTAKAKVTVRSFIDGDTTHFNMPAGTIDDDVLKARYLAINTPESTGQIEPWGKKASKFTKEALSKATSIIIESDNETWNLDSTGGRYLVWVWYRTSETEEYRNLNLEILQNGLALFSNTSRTRYGDVCVDALNQAKALKINCYSTENDPDFYYGDAQVLTLKEIRTNTKKYEGTIVSFDAVVTKSYNNALYVETFDETDNLYYGLYVYCGFGLSGAGLDIVSVGNKVRFVGSLQYYENGGTYQLADLKYQVMRPNDPTNIKLLETGCDAAFTLTDPSLFTSGTCDIEVNVDEENTEIKTFKYAELALNTSIAMNDLKVVRAYTTTNEDSSSKGAMTLTCEANGVMVNIRTVVLKDASGQIITEDAYLNKTIDVKGFVDYYNGEYQIKVFSANDIVIK